jgi:hypothetical protein
LEVIGRGGIVSQGREAPERRRPFLAAPWWRRLASPLPVVPGPSAVRCGHAPSTADRGAVRRAMQQPALGRQLDENRRDSSGKSGRQCRLLLRRPGRRPPALRVSSSPVQASRISSIGVAQCAATRCATEPSTAAFTAP